MTFGDPMNRSIISLAMASVLMWSTKSSLGATASVVCSLACGGQDNLVALTFDDGPSPHTTPQILKILRQYNVKATFFVVGERAKQYPHLIQSIVDEGHALGNHSFKHANLKKQSLCFIRQELVETNQAIECARSQSVSGSTDTPQKIPSVIFFRPPYGRISPKVVATAKSLGMITVLWNVDPGDWQKPNPAMILRRIRQQVKPGSIILLHDMHHNTVKALPMILQYLIANKYVITSLNHLNTSAHLPPQAPMSPPKAS